MLTEAQIQEAANRIVAALKPKKIILFGSYARGDATEDSDLDLMVIAPEKNTWCSNPAYWAVREGKILYAN